MNCLGCINKDYFYKNDTNDCILKADFEKRKNLKFSRLSDYNFYIFICILFGSAIIFIIICVYYYKVKQTKNQQNKKEEIKEEINEEIRDNNIEIELQNQFYVNSLNEI